jgi:hypothetical protein
MKISKVLKDLIVENSRFEVLLNKYTKSKQGLNGKTIKPIMDLTTYIKIILADPTTKKPQGYVDTDYSIENAAKLHPGDYSNWLLRYYEKPIIENETDNGEFAKLKVIETSREIFMEDLFKISDALKDFTKYKQYINVENRDINKFTPTTLWDFMFDFKIPEKLKKKEGEKEIKKQRSGITHPGGVIDFQGPEWTVIKISDKGDAGRDAARWYGGFRDYKHGESNWCTAEPNEGYNMFDRYIKDGPLYVLISNTDTTTGDRTGLPLKRYQFHFPSNQFMDRLDKSIDVSDFLTSEGQELKDYFKHEFAKGLTGQSGKKVEVDYPSGAASKFIALYGFDEFFETLPEDITQLLFNNRSDKRLHLKIPASIGRFKQLQSLMLQNAIDSLPKEIGELKNLTFASLINNNLKELPKEILTLPALHMIYLKGTDIQPSSEFLSKYTEQIPDSGMYIKKIN